MERKKYFHEDKLFVGKQSGKILILLSFSVVRNLKIFYLSFAWTSLLHKFKIILVLTLLERLWGLLEARMRGLLLASLVVLSVRQDVVETADLSDVLN
jgi:hypothetical protein